MNKIYCLLVTWCICTFTSPAQAEEKATWSGSVNIDYVSQYVGFGNGAVFYGKPMMQSSVCINHTPTGLAFSLWWGTGFNDNFSGSWDDEIDYGVSKVGTIGTLCYDAGVGYWDVFDLVTETHNDIIHPYVEFSRSFQVTSNICLTPFAKWDGYYLPFGADFDDGIVVSGGFKYAWSVNQTLSFTGLTSLGWDDGGFGFDTALIWKWYANLEWRLSDKLTLRVPTFQLYQPMGMSDGRNAQAVVGAGITYGF